MNLKIDFINYINQTLTENNLEIICNEDNFELLKINTSKNKIKLNCENNTSSEILTLIISAFENYFGLEKTKEIFNVFISKKIKSFYNINLNNLGISLYLFNNENKNKYILNLTQNFELNYYITKDEDRLMQFVKMVVSNNTLQENKEIIKKLLDNCNRLNTQPGKNNLICCLKKIYNNNSNIFSELFKSKSKKENPLFTSKNFNHIINFNKKELSNLLPLEPDKENVLTILSNSFSKYYECESKVIRLSGNNFILLMSSEKELKTKEIEEKIQICLLYIDEYKADVEQTTKYLKHYTMFNSLNKQIENKQNKQNKSKI